MAMTNIQLEQMLKQMFPNSTVTCSFDDSCINVIEACFFQAQVMPQHIIRYTKMKVQIDSNPATYYDIENCAQDISTADLIAKLQTLPAYSGS